MTWYHQATPFSFVHVENWLEPGDKAGKYIATMNGVWLGDVGIVKLYPQRSIQCR